MSTPLRAPAAASRALALSVLPLFAFPLAAQTVVRHSSVPSRTDDAARSHEAALDCRAAEEVVRAERARGLREEAMRLMEARSEWGRAAFRFERAAQASPACDRAAVYAWRMAARLYHHAAKPEASRLAFLGAAARARAVGDLVAAAHALLDAAVIAVDQGDQPAARRAVLAADTLSRSPGIPVEGRQSIRMRIVDLRTTAGLGDG